MTERPQRWHRWRSAARLSPLLLLLAPLPFLTVVPDDGMAPGLLAGDIVLLWPIGLPGGGPVEGGTVALVDPLDPARWTLRRIEAGAGEAVSCEDGFLLSPSASELVEMGRVDGEAGEPARIIVRAGGRLLYQPNLATTWDMEEIRIPEGWFFLSADNRIDALDSRWWGLLPVGAAQATVLARLGPPQHRWRGWWQWRP